MNAFALLDLFETTLDVSKANEYPLELRASYGSNGGMNPKISFELQT